MRGPFTIVLVAASIIGSSPVFHGQTSIPPQGSVTERASSIEDVIGRNQQIRGGAVARWCGGIYRPLIEVYIQISPATEAGSGRPRTTTSWVSSSGRTAEMEG